jgi:hypothetical protein
MATFTFQRAIPMATFTFQRAIPMAREALKLVENLGALVSRASGAQIDPY